ncbi:MAG TPA: CBS domain-containing protein, partial [bacterium]|nr:CBS domain-containing protein [bacterium]
ERDVLTALGSAAVKSGRRAHVRDFMRTPAITATPDDDVEAAAARMAEKKIGCLPVLEHGEVIGLVTTTDLLARAGGTAREIDNPRAVRVSAVMTADPPTALAAEPLADAAQRMSRLRVRHLPVIDEKGALIGILSERDVLRSAFTHRGGRWLGPMPPPHTVTVRAAMTASPVVIAPDAPISEAMTTFVQRRIGALPVVDDGGALRGIVSYVDILAHLGGGRIERAATPQPEAHP